MVLGVDFMIFIDEIMDPIKEFCDDPMDLAEMYKAALLDHISIEDMKALYDPNRFIATRTSFIGSLKKGHSVEYIKHIYDTYNDTDSIIKYLYSPVEDEIKENY